MQSSLTSKQISPETYYLFAKISFPECRLLALRFHDSPDNFTKFHELDAYEMLVHLQCSLKRDAQDARRNYLVLVPPMFS
jgi:hypothetical protein